MVDQNMVLELNKQADAANLVGMLTEIAGEISGESCFYNQFWN